MKVFYIVFNNFSALLSGECHPGCHPGTEDWREAGDGTSDEPPDEWKIFFPGRQLPALEEEEENKIHSLLEERNHQRTQGGSVSSHAISFRSLI